MAHEAQCAPGTKTTRMSTMGYARGHTVAEGEAGAYHLICRCVRRAWLCGEDPITGRNYDHRKQWLEERILAVSGHFAIDVYAYAVMSNHYHVVVWAEPRRVDEWSDEEVAGRWLELFPPKVGGRVERALIPPTITKLVSQKERMLRLRQRLGSVSWFMRLLNEPLARTANAEDEVNGRFWEGRFKSHALLDQAALLNCMAYVDLNPIRAGICDTLDRSFHTSIRRRIKKLQVLISGKRSEAASKPIVPVNRPAGEVAPITTITTREYIDLVEWSGRIIREDKTGHISGSTPPTLAKLGLDEDGWQRMLTNYQQPGWAIGSVESLLRHARKLKKRWLAGLKYAGAHWSPPLKRKK